jgi:hypothetical protein
VCVRHDAGEILVRKTGPHACNMNAMRRSNGLAPSEHASSTQDAVRFGLAGLLPVTLLGASSLAHAAAPIEQVAERLSQAHPVHSQREVLNLGFARIPTATLVQHSPQRFAEPPQSMPSNLFFRPAIAPDEEGRSAVAFTIRWQNNPSFVNPKLVSLARNFRHNGLPIVHLWESGRNLLAIGLNPHGKPGIYFTQQLPD